jgi:hypothetical protein
VGLAAGRAGGGDAVSDTLATVLSLLRQRASG